MAIDLVRTRKLMVSKGVDVLVVHSPQNFLYVTGLYDSTFYMLMSNLKWIQFAVIPLESDPVLLINTAVLENAREMSWIEDIRTVPTGMWLLRKRKHEDFADDIVVALGRTLEERRLESAVLGIENRYMTVDLSARLRERLPGARLSEAGHILQSLRAIKTNEEISKLSKAVETNEKGLQAGMAAIADGATDFEIAKRFRSAVADVGGEMSHFILGIGPKGGLPFREPSGCRAKKGDIVRLDTGTLHSGYRSDLTRCAVIGEPSQRTIHLYQALLAAAVEGAKRLKPGVRLSQVHATIQETVRDAGYGDYARTSFGHGIGVECDEEPEISASNDTVLEPNMVMNIEVPWYEPGWGSLNVEDTYVLTRDGCRQLSTLPKDLYVVHAHGS